MSLRESLSQGLVSLTLTLPLLVGATPTPQKVSAILNTIPTNSQVRETCQEQGEWLVERIKEQISSRSKYLFGKQPISHAITLYPNGITNNGYVLHSAMKFIDGGETTYSPELLNIDFPSPVLKFGMRWEDDKIHHMIQCEETSAANN